MSEEIEPSVGPSSHQRILLIMAALGVAGGVAGAILHSAGFGLGVLIGTALAFANYYWLKISLQKIFKAAESGERPRMLAGRYFLRYIVIGVVVAAIYLTEMVPIIPVILGLAAFGFAVVLEGLIRMSSRPAGQ
jgi:hypothetical protein